MAFEADCGSSTVLEASYLTTAFGFLIRGECQASAAPRVRRNLAVEGTFRRGSSGLKIPILLGSIARECPL